MRSSINQLPDRILLIFFTLLALINSTNSACNASNCPPVRGLCVRNVCVCTPKYTTVNNEYVKNNGINCNYELKSKLFALLLEFFFPFGMGHYYSEKMILFSIKLCLFGGLILSCCFIACFLAEDKITGCQTVLTLIFLLCIISLFILQIIDLVSYGFGLYHDGNGVAMI